MEDSIAVYGIYNSDTLEQLIDTVHRMHSHTTWNEKSFAGQIHQWYQWYLHKDRTVLYATNLLLFLITTRV